MAYKNGRWVPSEDINWKRDTEAEKQTLRLKLQGTGLNWWDHGRDAFRTDIWGDLNEEQRFQVLEQYDTAYDTDPSIVHDMNWGLDLERGLSYNQDTYDIGRRAQTIKTGDDKWDHVKGSKDVGEIKGNQWDALEVFNAMTGGKVVYNLYQGKFDMPDPKTGEVKGFYHDVKFNNKSEYHWDAHTHADKVRERKFGTLVQEHTNEDGDVTGVTWKNRDNAMDWSQYSEDPLYRAAIDELMEDHPTMFVGPGDDFTTAKQVRAASKEIQSWVQEVWDRFPPGSEFEDINKAVKAELDLQIKRGAITNKRYPYGDETRGFQYNQAVAIKKYKPWNEFDPDSGTVTKINPITGEIRDTYQVEAAPPPVRFTVTDNKLDVDHEKGIYYSGTKGLQQKITDSMHPKPPAIPKPTSLTIRTVTNNEGLVKRPANIPTEWRVGGVE
jgi:hypothetical protein